LTRRNLALSCGLCLCLFGAPAQAQTLGAEGSALYAAATEALAKGAYTEALMHFELLADRGIVHPDVSFDRAVAYGHRARSPQARPGDLGRCAFALSETIALRPDDVEAKALLTRVDQELSRARSRRGNPSLLARPRLTRALIGLLPENVWAVCAAISSLTTTLGLLYRFGSARPRRRLAGAVTAWLGAALLGLTSFGLLYARHQRHETRQGVVVSTDARLLDATAAPLSIGRRASEDQSIPEGAQIVVTGRTDRLLEVEWGSIKAYVSPSDVQLLPKQK
jgi:hypothetical protein